MFVLDKNLERDSLWAGIYQSIQIRLMKDSRFFWVLLIPQRADIYEWHDLNETETAELIFLINHFSKKLKNIENPDKINIGALGNMVRQFHFHIICRYQDDPAWPGPVWGSGPFMSSPASVIESRLKKLQKILGSLNNR